MLSLNISKMQPWRLTYTSKLNYLACISNIWKRKPCRKKIHFLPPITMLCRLNSKCHRWAFIILKADVLSKECRSRCFWLKRANVFTEIEENNTQWLSNCSSAYIKELLLQMVNLLVYWRLPKLERSQKLEVFSSPTQVSLLLPNYGYCYVISCDPHGGFRSISWFLCSLFGQWRCH